MNLAMRPLLDHLTQLEQKFKSLAPHHAFVFGISCAERQWPIYELASEGKVWSNQQILRQILDKTWDWLLGEGEFPHGCSEMCEKAILESIEDENASFAYHVTVSLSAYFYNIENNLPTECFRIGGENLELIETLVYDLYKLPISSQNDPIIDRHPLMMEEMSLQKGELAVLLAQKIPLGKIVNGFRDHSKSRSIFQNYWHS